MDVVGRVKEIGEHISVELQDRKEKLAADAKDAIRRLGKCVKELLERAERGTLTKVDEDLEGLAADVTRKMGRIGAGVEEAQRAKKLLAGFQEEVLAIREATTPEASPVDPHLLEENKGLVNQVAELQKELAELQKKAAAGAPPFGGAAPSAGRGGAVTTPSGKKDESGKTPEQEAEEQAAAGGAAKKAESKK